MRSTWNFIKNNKKTILFTSTAIIGLIGLRRYIRTFQKQWQYSQSKNFVSEVRKKGLYFDESLAIGNQMVEKQCTLIIAKLKQLCNIVPLLNTIKDAQRQQMPPVEQLKYYEELKIEIFTYLLAEIYSITFFICYLRVQLSMISGIMYHENQIKSKDTNGSTVTSNTGAEDSNSNQSSSADSFQLNDQSSRYFLFIGQLENFHHHGIEHLVKSLRTMVKNHQGFQNELKITDEINLNGLFRNLNDLKSKFQQNFSQLIDDNVMEVFVRHTNAQKHLHNLSDKAMDSNSENPKAINEYKASIKFIDELLDITKLKDFHQVLDNCLDIGYSNLFDFLNECFIRYERSNSNQSNTSKQPIESNRFINPHQIKIIMIKLLPLIWQQVHTTASADGGHNSGSKLMANQSSLSNNEFIINDDDDDPNGHGHNTNSMNYYQMKNRNSLLIQFLLCSDILTCFAANIYEAFCNDIIAIPPSSSMTTSIQ